MAGIFLSLETVLRLKGGEEKNIFVISLFVSSSTQSTVSTLLIYLINQLLPLMLKYLHYYFNYYSLISNY